MARTSIIMREKKRIKLCEKNFAKRQALKTKIRELQKDYVSNYDSLNEAYNKLRTMARDTNPCRIRNRCRLTGRPRGYYRKVGLSRNMFRLYAMAGDIPGLVKSSW